jgi:hypothetical protein
MATHTTAEDKKSYTSGQAVDYFKNIHDGLLAVGLTKTADTGQLDLTTAPTVVLSSANHDYGYSIFQFTDAYQSTYPIFLKVRYTNMNAATTQPVTVRVEIGEGTDGSGNLTGKTDTNYRTNTSTSTTNASTLSTNNIAFIDGNVVISTGVTATSGTINGYSRRLWVIGRRKDMSGNYTKGFYKLESSGVTATTASNNNIGTNESHVTEYRNSTGLLNHDNLRYEMSVLNPYHWDSEVSNQEYDNSNPVFPLYCLTPVPEYLPGLIATPGGIGHNVSFVSDFDGTKTFLTSGSSVGGNSSLVVAHIWE